eukprot:gene32145-39699_t
MENVTALLAKIKALSEENALLKDNEVVGYLGEKQDGEMHGVGLDKSDEDKFYVGEYFNGKKSGYGLLKCDDWVYHGQFLDDRELGFGVTILGGGSKHVGEYVEGHYEGQGTLTDTDGKHGTTTYANGDTYVGGYLEDDRHGSGVFTAGIGDVMEEGNYHEGMKHGYSKITSGGRFVEKIHLQGDRFFGAVALAKAEGMLNDAIIATTHRKLYWSVMQGSVVLTSTFGGVFYDVEVSVLQAIVLLAFNSKIIADDSSENDMEVVTSSAESSGSNSNSGSSGSVRKENEFSLEELEVKTGIKMRALEAVLHTLAMNKHTLVTLRHDDQGHYLYSLNDDFKSDTLCFALNTPPLENSIFTQPTFEEEKLGLKLEAAIVHIMKFWKTQTHDELVAKVFAHIKEPAENHPTLLTAVMAALGNFSVALSEENALLKDKEVVGYLGEKQNAEMHGVGLDKACEDEYYTGEYLHGKRSGFGMLRSGGLIYHGQFEDNRGNYHGEGTLTNSDGSVFVGIFQSSAKETGKMTYPNGEVYYGKWKENKWHGKGVLKTTNGGIFTGVFLNGLRHGFFNATLEEGGVQEKVFHQDTELPMLTVTRDAHGVIQGEVHEITLAALDMFRSSSVDDFKEKLALVLVRKFKQKESDFELEKRVIGCLKVFYCHDVNFRKLE